MRQEIINLLQNRSGPLLFGKSSYAQEGEDLIVDRILQGKKNGFYVEVGCHHPFRFSNTYLFYKRGWRGVCIDPLPGTGALFKRWRPRDLTLETGVSDAPAKLTYFMFNEPALNTFDPGTAEAKDGLGPYRIVARKEIPVEPLGRILDRLGVREEIDFMSVDVEGLDMKVLRSNDWERYRPGIMIVECLGTTLADLMENEINIFLTQLGYDFHAKTGNSAIFVSRTM